MRAVLLLAFSAAIGCIGPSDDPQDSLDELQGLTHPMVLQGMVLGIEEPEPALRPVLEQAGFQPGVALTSLLANASRIDNLDNATMSGATVIIETPDDAELARDQGDGLYIIDPRNSELTYHKGEVWTLWAQAGMDIDSAIDITLPGLAPIEVPPEHVAGAPLYIDFTGMGYDRALVMVYDIEGNETWSNAPVTVEEVYAMTQTDAPLTVIEVPAEAFPESGLYGMGVAGLFDARPEDLYAVNTHLSGGTAGKLKIYPIAAQ